MIDLNEAHERIQKLIPVDYYSLDFSSTRYRGKGTQTENHFSLRVQGSIDDNIVRSGYITANSIEELIQKVEVAYVGSK